MSTPNFHPRAPSNAASVNYDRSFPSALQSAPHSSSHSASSTPLRSTNVLPQSSPPPSDGGVNTQMFMLLYQQQTQQLNELKAKVEELSSSQASFNPLSAVWSASERRHIQAQLDTLPRSEHIRNKPGGGNMRVEYLSGGFVVSALNEVFGYNGWSDEYCEEQTEITKRPDPATGRGNFKVICQVKCIITLADKSFKSDVGTCCGEMGDFASAVDTSKKGAYTDALKRAARKFGKYLGACLYETKESARKTAPKNETERQRQVEEKRKKAEDKAMSIPTPQLQQEVAQGQAQVQVQHHGGENSSAVANVQQYNPQQHQQHTPARAQPAYQHPPQPQPQPPVPQPQNLYQQQQQQQPPPPAAVSHGGQSSAYAAGFQPPSNTPQSAKHVYEPPRFANKPGVAAQAVKRAPPNPNPSNPYAKKPKM